MSTLFFYQALFLGTAVASSDLLFIVIEGKTELESTSELVAQRLFVAIMQGEAPLHNFCINLE